MRKSGILLVAFVCATATMLSACTNEKSETRDFLNETQKVAEESTQEQKKEISQTETKITKEYLKERYPDKTIIEYLYPEPEILNNKFVPRYEEEQIMELNDYLVESNQEYVIYFRGIPYQEFSVENVKNIINSDEVPDIITSSNTKSSVYKTLNGGNGNEVPDINTEMMIYSGIFEEMSSWQDSEIYQNFLNTMPQQVYDLSTYNGKFYGFKNELFFKLNSYYVYNQDIVDKYNINKQEIEEKSLLELMPILDKVAQGERKTENFVTAPRAWPEIENFVNPNIYFDDYRNEPVFLLQSIGMEADNESKFVLITDSKKMRDDWKATYEVYKKGYTVIANSTVEGEDDDIDRPEIAGELNAFLYTTENEDENIPLSNAQSMFGKVKRIGVAKKKTTVMHDVGKWAIINGICAQSKNKEMALKALTFLYNDKKATNIIKNTENIVTNIGNCYLYDDAYYGSKREDLKKTLEEAKILKSMEGYYFDLTDYKEQAKKVYEIEEKYFEADLGSEMFSDKYSSFEEAWSDAERQLKEAGAEEIVAEINRQYDAIRK